MQHIGQTGLKLRLQDAERMIDLPEIAAEFPDPCGGIVHLDCGQSEIPLQQGAVFHLRKGY